MLEIRTLSPARKRIGNIPSLRMWVWINLHLINRYWMPPVKLASKSDCSIYVKPPPPNMQDFSF